MATRILAVDDSPVILRLVSQTLLQVGFEVFTARDGLEALSVVDEVQPNLIILDVLMPHMNGYETCRRLRSKPNTARLPIMMLTGQDTLKEKVQGFEAGADEYITKPFHPAELMARVSALVRRATQPPAQAAPTLRGKTIAVFSLRGGVGVSTVAANLAVGLSQLWQQPAVLVDMVRAAGQGAFMLNLAARSTWADLAQVALRDLDSEAVERVLLSHASQTRVLVAPRNLEQARQISPELVARVLELLAARYPYVVLDMPHDFAATTLAGLDAADEILALIAPDAASVMGVEFMQATFQGLGYAADKIRLALNCTFDCDQRTRLAIENALGRPAELVIPYAGNAVVAAINAGVPLVVDKPESEIGAALEDLAFNLSREDQRGQQPAAPSLAWRRVAGRAHL